MSTAVPQRSSTAVFLVLAAMLAFAVMDGLTKILTITLPITQVLWVRSIVFTACALALLRLQARGRTFSDLATSRRPALQFVRAVLLVVESAIFMLAFSMLPLADAHALGAATPLMVVALSVPVLGEHVGPRRWAAVVVGFIGVLVIVRPGFQAVTPGMLVALAGAFLWAIYQVLVRIVSRSDSVETTSLWTAAVGLLATTMVGPFGWVWPDPQAWMMLIVIALLGSMAHVAMISALGRTQPAVLQPFMYTLFVWAVVVGYAFFGDVPDRWTLIGATVIIASGLYVWHRERVRAGLT